MFERAHLCGVLNDDSNAVGQVHAGLVYTVAVPPDTAGAITVRETSKMAGAMRGIHGADGLWQHAERLESWSRILLAALWPPPG